jgi:hypothetical protein
MGMRMPETCWAVFKRQAIKLRDWCIWLVDLVEDMMMQGLTNPKLRIPICIKCKIDHIFKYFHFYLTKIWPQRKAHPCSNTYISSEFKSQDSGASKTLYVPWKWRQKRIGRLFARLVMWVQGLLFPTLEGMWLWCGMLPQSSKLLALY